MARPKQKANLLALFDDVRGRFLKTALNIGVFIIFIAMILLSARAFLYGSGYFKVRSVEMVDTSLDNRTASYISSQILNAYKGRGIFTVDLRAIAGVLNARFPDAKEIMVRIALPDKITVNMKFRWPVALLRGAKLYPVDDEGVVLLNANPALFKFLPVIYGIEVSPGERIVRRGNNHRNLKLALTLLNEIRNARFLKEYGPVTLNAVDPKSLSFTLKGGVEVKIGFENFKTRLEMLRKVLGDSRMVMGKVDYIDIRFKDVVIGPRED